MMVDIFFLLSLMICPAAAEIILNERVCQKSVLKLDCDAGMVIHVIDALYGRTKPVDLCNSYKEPTDCIAPNSLSKMMEMCENKTECSVEARNRVFGRPCSAVNKYLEANYTCVVTDPLVTHYNPERTAAVNSNGTTVAYVEPTAADNSGTVPMQGNSHDTGVVLNLNGIRVTFLESQHANQSVDSIQRCPSSSSRPNATVATRYCGESWGKVEMTQCFDEETLDTKLKELSQTNVTMANVQEVATIMLVVSSQVEDISPSGLENLIMVLESVIATGTASAEVVDSVVGVTNNVMTLGDDVLADTSNLNEVVPLLEKQIKVVQNYTRTLPNLGISALLLERTSLEQSTTYEDPFMEGPGTSDGNNTDTWSSITLPPSILDMIEAMTSVPVSFITYRDSGLFQPSAAPDEMRDTPNITDEYVDGHVIAATIDIDSLAVSGLLANSTVLVTFSKPVAVRGGNRTNTTTEFVCVFWDHDESDRSGRWSQEGCRRIDNDGDEITCSCDHLTSFAVLVRITDTKGNERFQMALDIITVVGCVISILGLACCVALMLIFGSLRKKQQTHVHLNLCLALLGLYLSFLFGIDKFDQPELCRAMTSVIYFFCVSSVAWMTVEAYYIYMLIWKYNQSSIRHLISVAVMLAWGLPLIAAVLVFFLDRSHDYSADADYCFIHPGPALHVGFLLEVFALFLSNFAIFILATFRVNSREIRFSKADNKRQELETRIRGTFLFWVLLGMAWMFGFIATFHSPLSLTFQMLFCVSLSLQGFFMFYMLVVQNPEMRKSGLQVLSRRSKPTSSVSAAVVKTSIARAEGSSYAPDASTYQNQSFGVQVNPDPDEEMVDNITYGID